MCHEGDNEQLLITSDSKVTAGFVSYETKKIYPIKIGEQSLAIAAGSGDASLIKQACRLAEVTIRNRYLNQWGNQQPTFEQFEEAVKHIESRLIRRFRELKNLDIEIRFRMILGNLSTDNRISLYVFDSRGLAQPVHYNPGYSIIGMGSITGGVLLYNLLGCNPRDMTIQRASYLSTFIIDAVSDIDPTVGPFVGELWYIRMENDTIRVSELFEEYIEPITREIEKRKEILTRIWKCCDDIDSETIIEAIERLEEEAAFVNEEPDSGEAENGSTNEHS